MEVIKIILFSSCLLLISCVEIGNYSEYKITYTDGSTELMNLNNLELMYVNENGCIAAQKGYQPPRRCGVRKVELLSRREFELK